MTIVFPEATPILGNTSVVVAQTIADPDAPSLATEVNAASSVNVSCFLYSGGVGTSTTNKGAAPRRLCSKRTVQQFGETTYDVTDLVYTYDPQADSTADANKARAALAEGSEVYLVIRRGLDAEEVAHAAGQIVDIWKVTLGPQNKTQTGDGEFDEYSITQSVIGELVAEDVEIAA